MWMDQSTDRLPSIIALHVNICVFWKTSEQHDDHLIQLMQTTSRMVSSSAAENVAYESPQISF